MNKTWKILIPILFALALLLGFIERKNLAEFSLGSTQSHAQFSRAVSDDDLEGYYQKAQSLRGTANTTNSATFLAAGDVMLSRKVATSIQKSGNVNLPFSNMESILKSTDFNFANLETPVAEKKGTIGGDSLIFNSPQENVKKLADNNFQIVNLANNHAFDQGLAGLDFTQTFLNNLGIKHAGTGDSLEQAWQPAVVEANGIKICFVGASYASVNDSGKTENDYVARIEDLNNLQSAIRNSQSLCDFVVVTMHAGTEYTRNPNDAQTAFAHAAIDDGADMVIGAHPHWVQTIENYKGKYIFYSLGNFIFDQNFSQETREGLTLKITISKQTCSQPIHGLTEDSTADKPVPHPDAGSANYACADSLQGSRIQAQLDSIELTPVIIENFSTPRPATAAETKMPVNWTLFCQP